MDTCSICNENKVAMAFPFADYAVCICNNCGLHWLSPQPTDAELDKIYSNQYFLDEGAADITEIVNNFLERV